MKTAVEWIFERLERMIPRTKLYDIDKKQYLEQAKEIEKEQSRKDYYGGVRDEMQNTGSDFEDYYNKTYANDTTKGLPEENSKRRGWHY